MSKPIIYHINRVISNTGTVDFGISGGVKIASGDTLTRPASPAPGYVRFNTDIGMYEGYDGNGWIRLGSFVSDSDGDTTVTAEDQTGDNSNRLVFRTSGAVRAIFNNAGDFFLAPSIPDDEIADPQNSSLYVSGTTGNVGVKTHDPDADLTVNGTVKSTNFVGRIDGGALTDTSTRIINKKTATPGEKPLVSQLDTAELAVNTYDGKLYLKKYQEYFDNDLQETVTVEEIVEFASSVPVENTLYVQKAGDDRNDGLSWSSAFATIEAAVAAAAARNSLTLIEIGPGVFETEGHIDLPDNTVVKAVHRSTFVVPKPGFEERNVFRIGSGCFIEGIVFERWRLDSLTNPTEGFAIVFRPGARITRVPYVHKIVVRTPPYWTTVAPPLDRRNANPLVGRGAGVVLADASVLDPYTVFPNIMTWGATPVTHNGIGYVAKNGGLINAVNAVSMWCHKHFLAQSGGQIILSSCATQFGDYTMVSEGSRKIIQPEDLPDPITGNLTDFNTITANSSTLIDDMWDQLVLEGFTAEWPENYETLTRKDAGLFLQSLGWTIGTGDEKPMQDFAKGFFTVTGDRAFVPADYDYEKCKRDVGLITDAVVYDILFGSNFRSIRAAQSYYRASAAEVVNNQKTNTILAITEQRAQFAARLSGDSLLRSNALFDEIINIIENGESAASVFQYPDPDNATSDFIAARDQVLVNRSFIQEEIIAWINLQNAQEIAPFTQSFVYDSVACKRDVGFIIDGLVYDLTYGGNLETYTSAMAYFVGTLAQYGSGEKSQTIAAYYRLKDIIDDIAQGIQIIKSSGNPLDQDIAGAAGSINAAIFAQDRIDDIIGTLNSDGTPPVRIMPGISWPSPEFIASFNSINTDAQTITNSVMRYLNLETKTLLGAFIYSWEYLRDRVNLLVSIGSQNSVNSLVGLLTKTILDPITVFEPSTITAIGHTWTGIMAGVALTKIPPARNRTTIQESILELDQGIVIASGQDDQGSALFIGGMEINADTGELTGPPFDQAVNRIATRAAIARSF
jgi:hypothetical protein